MKTFGKILLTLLILGGLGYGGWYGYNRFFAEAPKEGTVYVQSVATITGVGAAGRRSRYAGVVEAKNVIQVNPDTDLTVKECFVSAGDKVKKAIPSSATTWPAWRSASSSFGWTSRALRTATRPARRRWRT